MEERRGRRRSTDDLLRGVTGRRVFQHSQAKELRKHQMTPDWVGAKREPTQTADVVRNLGGVRN
eukprot:1376166-Pyramimonas_sp.AAC.1